jgi:hypothetical protein
MEGRTLQTRREARSNPAVGGGWGGRRAPGTLWGVSDVADGDAVFRGAGGGADDEFAVADLGLEGVGGPFAIVGQRRVVDRAPAVPVGLGERLFLGRVLGDCCASSGKGSAARSSARTDRERSRISWPSKVVQGGSWDTRGAPSPLVPGASSSTMVSWDESSAQLDMLVGSRRGRSNRCARVGSFPC